MKITGLIPDNILKLMPKEERARLGISGVTKEEAQHSFEIKNERELQKLIRNELLRRDIPHSWSRTDKRTTNVVGWPDFTFPINGYYGFIEVKYSGGQLSKEQEKVIESLIANGAKGVVARDFNSAKEFLDTLIEQRTFVTAGML